MSKWLGATVGVLVIGAAAYVSMQEYNRASAEREIAQNKARCQNSLNQLGKVFEHRWCLNNGYITQEEFDRQPIY